MQNKFSEIRVYNNKIVNNDDNYKKNDDKYANSRYQFDIEFVYHDKPLPVEIMRLVMAKDGSVNNSKAGDGKLVYIPQNVDNFIKALRSTELDVEKEQFDINGYDRDKLSDIDLETFHLGYHKADNLSFEDLVEVANIKYFRTPMEESDRICNEILQEKVSKLPDRNM